MIFSLGRSINRQINSPFPHMPPIHKQIITQSFSNIPLCSNIQKSTFPHQPKAGGPPFLSRTGNLRAPALINSNSFCEIALFIFFSILISSSKNVYLLYFMLYLAESLTGRSYTEGKLLRYYPLWRERVKVANFVCCRQIPMEFGTVWSGMFYSCKGQECKSWLMKARSTFSSLEREGDHRRWWKVESSMWVCRKMPRCCAFQLSWSFFSLFFTTKSMYSHTP